jgi:hypothetical protein
VKKVILKIITKGYLYGNIQSKFFICFKTVLANVANIYSTKAFHKRAQSLPNAEIPRDFCC